MADDGGAGGVLGAIIAVIAVVAIGLAVLSYNGNVSFGGRAIDVKVDPPGSPPTPK